MNEQNDNKEGLDNKEDLLQSMDAILVENNPSNEKLEPELKTEKL